MLIYCCEWFEQLMRQAGEKGFSIIAYRDGEHRSFYLQTRSFEQDVLDKYNSIDNGTGKNKWPELYDTHGIPVPWIVAMHIPLRYCPRCGADLSKRIREKLKEFDLIAYEMRKFYN